MKDRSSAIFGIVLILIGAALLLRNYIDIDLDMYTLRSYGLLIVGTLGFVFNVGRTPRRGMFFFPALAMIGLYYTLGELDLIPITRGMSLSAWTIVAGLAFYPAYIFSHNRSLNKLVMGNIILIVGLIFLSYELDIISTRLFVTIFDKYWPVAIILVGVGFIISGLRRQGGGPVESREMQQHSQP